MSQASLQKYTAIYRCSDDITNFKIRFVEGDLADACSDNCEQRDFSWQQKVFSRLEKEFYGDLANCVTDLEKQYHSDVLRQDAETKFDIFSYVNDDDFVVKEECNHYCESSDEEDDENATNYDYKKSVEAAVRNPVCHNHFEAMHIMADLGEFIDTTWIKNETVLCSVKYDKKRKILLVFPDFTIYQPYNIKVEGNTTRNFFYYIENVSQSISETEDFNENELLRKLNQHKASLVKQNIPNFPLPAKNKLQVYLFFEILYAKQFQYNPIYVQYFIDLPPDWSCVNQSQLRGITQTCSAKDTVAHFGHQFDIVLEYNIEGLKDKIPKCPYIYFEVISKDTFTRFRTEGLTYKNIPMIPGNYLFQLQCCRLVPDTISGRLRRFFIGDCSTYNDITLIGLPSSYEGSLINKFGSEIVGSGELCVRLNVMQHSQAFLDKYQEGSDRADIFAKLNSSSLVKSVEQVLKAFKKARKNMLAARKNV